MPYWTGNRFLDHASELLAGAFISPAAGDLMTLTHGTRNLLQATLANLPQDPNKQNPLWLPRFGFALSKQTLEAFAGMRISHDLYGKTMVAAEQSGVFIVTREAGSANFINFGALLATCENTQCLNARHYPHWGQPTWLNPSDKQSTPSDKQSTPLVKSDDTTLIYSDIKSIKSSKELINTFTAVSTDLEVSLIDEAQSTSDQPEQLQAQANKELTPNLEKYLEIQANLSGTGELRRRHWAHAQDLANKGLDLPDNGTWLQGGVEYPQGIQRNPSPETQEANP